MKKITDSLLLAGFILCLLYVWLPTYFVTGDGPCHLYNAQILHDLWLNKNTAFYKQYYDLLYQPNPNWLSTIIIGLLLFVVKGVIAEKIFLTIYVILYISGFYLLLKKTGRTNSYFPLVILLFVFPHTLSKGFYNYSFSIAFYFWMVWGWLRFLEKRNIGNALLFLLFTSLIFFTHLLSFGFGAFTCAALLLSYSLANVRDNLKQKFVPFFLKNAGFLFLMLLPFLFMMIWFTQKEGGLQMQLRPHLYRLLELAQFKYLVNITSTESLFAVVTGITLLSLFCFSLLRFKNKISVNKYDGFLLSLLFVLFVYLFFPEDFLGRLILISMRVQLYVFLLVACCSSYMLPPGKIETTGSIILLGCFIGLSFVRISCMLSASNGVADYVSGVKYIKPNSVVLPFDFSPGGKNEKGDLIADRNWLFTHAAQYMGTEKPLIILDNYEANMGYFPLVWKDTVNPYRHLSKQEGIEGQPPYAEIDGYKQTSGVTINYILMWCYDSSFLHNEDFRKLYSEINIGYHPVYTSATGRTTLYEKN